MAKSKPEKSVLSSGRVKNLIRIARIVGPVVAPYALQAASAARESYDRMRARKLGVPVADLGKFTGRGAALHARIAGITKALNELGEHAAVPADAKPRKNAAPDTTADYREQVGVRLAELAAVVRAAERMPSARRRTTHHSVARELDAIEADLLNHLGI